MPTPSPPLNSQPETRVVHVLALDDNEFDLQMLQRCLRGMKPWEVVVTPVGSLEAALEAIETRDFELLFLDYMLTPHNGFHALSELRARGFRAPTILMTGMQSEAVLVEAMQAGAVDFLPKSALSMSSVQRATHNAIEKADLAREVSRKGDELRETLRRLERRQKEIESFYHNVSHELKTPLTGSREYVSLVIDGAVGEITEDQSKLLHAALRGCDRMVTCINDMLDASRLDIGKVALISNSVNLASLLRNAAKGMEQAAADRDVQIQLHLPDDEEMVVIDQQRIEQVATILLSNAIKFSPPGGRVEVTLEARSWAQVVVTVKDHGCGIHPDDAERVFERLYQSELEDPATQGGLGMGLYIAREILELHGGQISVSGEPGKGCTATFTLPHCAPAPVATG